MFGIMVLYLDLRLWIEVLINIPLGREDGYLYNHEVGYDDDGLL